MPDKVDIDLPCLNVLLLLLWLKVLDFGYLQNEVLPFDCLESLRVNEVSDTVEGEFCSRELWVL